MRKLILTSVIFLITLNAGIAQLQWLKKDYASNTTAIAVYTNYIVAASHDKGIFLSTDDGKSWNLVSTRFKNISINSMVFYETYLFASTDTSGVFLSTDFGSNWIKVSNGLTTDSITCMAVNGKDIYVGTRTKGIFKTTNNGSQWFPVNNGLPDLRIHCIAVSDGYIYTATDIRGIYISMDNGYNWSLYCKSSENYNINSISVTTNNIAFIGNQNVMTNVYYSNNQGITWRTFGYPNMNEIYSVGVIQDKMIVADYRGTVYFSYNFGNSWDKVINPCLLSISYTCIALSPEKFLFGNQDGIYSISTKDGSLMSLSSDLGTAKLNTIASGGNTLYAGTGEDMCAFCGVFTSINNTSAWLPKSNDSTNSMIGEVSCITAQDSLVFVGTPFGGLYSSSNQGDNWKEVAFYGMASSVSIEKNIACGVYMNSVSVSTDFGKSWNSASEIPEKPGNLSSVVVKDRSIYVASYDCKGIFKSSDLGHSWTHLGYDSISISSMAVSENRIFLGETFAYHGKNVIEGNGNSVVYHYYDGSKWSRSSLGSIGYKVTGVAVIGTTVYAATEYNGVYYADLNKLSINDFPDNKPLFNILYSDRTNIYKIILPAQSRQNASLVLYDMLGNKVRTILENIQSFDEIQTELDATNLQCGAYFLRYTNNKEVITEKLMICS